MPVLHINNLADDEEAYIENGAQKNVVETISLNGEELSINNKNINLELAKAADIALLFIDTFKVVKNLGLAFNGDNQTIVWVVIIDSNLNIPLSLALNGTINNLNRAIDINQIEINKSYISTNVIGSLTPLTEESTSSFEIELHFFEDTYVEIEGFKFKIKKDSKLKGKGNTVNREFEFKEGALTGQYGSTSNNVQIIEGFTLERV